MGADLVTTERESECREHSAERCAVEFARIDERLKAMVVAAEMRERTHSSALKIASDELARRLDHLNGEAARIAQMQATMVSREIHDAKMDVIQRELVRLDGEFREHRGRLWLPMLSAAALAAGLASAIARWIL